MTPKTSLRQIRGVCSRYHVGLPGVPTRTSVNTPPEVVLWFSSPRKHRDAWDTEQATLRGESEEVKTNRWVSFTQSVAPRSARAAATAFWVEKMLQAAQRHWAPNTMRVSISTCNRERNTFTFRQTTAQPGTKTVGGACSSLSELTNQSRQCFVCVCVELTAVCAVMCVQPNTLAPARGFSPPARFLRTIRAGISRHHRQKPITNAHVHVSRDCFFLSCVSHTGWKLQSI